ncbi:unnamed protein product [Periconia digitata]|uniref:Uncharacterized protein n=1 Tax=Periconia digitata TaxID=1303443 RepID=A0A9W4XW84_9PLEO|nr:unnamed protein product [Periconia digitata]
MRRPAASPLPPSPQASQARASQPASQTTGADTTRPCPLFLLYLFFFFFFFFSSIHIPMLCIVYLKLAVIDPTYQCVHHHISYSLSLSLCLSTKHTYSHVWHDINQSTIAGKWWWWWWWCIRSKTCHCLFHYIVANQLACLSN